MAKITQFSINCPHCKKEIESGWGTGDATTLPDRFSCPHCRQTVQLSDELQMKKAANRQTRGGFIIVLLIVSFFVSLVVRFFAKGYTGGQLDLTAWLVIIGISLVIGLIISIFIQAFRFDRAMARIKAAKAKQT